jgi:hypothetical protein
MASSNSRRPEFLDRLADLVPLPRRHRHRERGVFAPNHKLRRAGKGLERRSSNNDRESPRDPDARTTRMKNPSADLQIS